jgi:mannose-6-phosphate isomerase-like protein (cupin superfamily)
MTEKINIGDVLDGVGDWSPQVVGEVNDYDLKAANLDGDFVEHVHADTDEIFIVLSGRLYLDLPGETVTLDPFDVYTVPAGVTHHPRAEPGTRVLMVEPRGTTQNGEADGNTGHRVTGS